jgi:dTDP-glucose 4,6-dehydratase
MRNIMVTGGAGFIGSHLVRLLLQKAPDCRVINYDALTYAGNPYNLADVTQSYGGERYFFEQGDIADPSRVEQIFTKYDIDTIFHLAAETHVDRAILGPAAFIQTNIVGTFTLLEAARKHWAGRNDVLFQHISTDEVFGSLDNAGFFNENTPYDPRSPYSAAKASSDHLVRAWHHTYGLPVIITNCSNNYGPCQFPEKLIPLMILNMSEGKPLPVYGDGAQVRDWLYVTDHCNALYHIACRGERGSTYCIGGDCQLTNLQLLTKLVNVFASITGTPVEQLLALVNHVKDRPGHDRRYAIDCRRLKAELGWKPLVSLDDGLQATVNWYLSNPEWIEKVKTGEYRLWLQKQYG